MSISDLPALNASLNAISTLFLAVGWWAIRRNLWRQHIALMIAALLTSAAFLVSYLIYHAHAGSVRFTAQGIVRPIYFTILITHVLLAFVILPLVIVTVVPALRRRWDKHRRLGRWTMPIWLYVSVTGVLVYLMLYRWFPPAGVGG
jgi:putative membrane protein